MNKRIYFNDKFIELVDKNESELTALQTHTLNDNINSKKKLKLFIDAFLDEKNLSNQTLIDFNLNDLIDFFKEQYYYIEAAGGLIKKEGSYLFILRHGLWDLPKGKLEKNESLEHAAIRECEEECAIKELHIEKQINSTFHIYPYKKSYALKQSYWYNMHTNYNQKLIPQIEEDIHDVQWFTVKEIKEKVLPLTYYTIHDLVTQEVLNKI